jgi:N-acetylglutamate synthase-like GNAT family acetyltransferase
MADKFEIIDIEYTNVDTCQCCGANPVGIRRKREWIRQCLPNGLRYRTVHERTTGKIVGLIEYMPGAFAWRAVKAKNWMVIHCIMVWKRCTGQGLGSMLIQQCIADARKHGMDGVVALATKKGWCADSRLYLKNGFEIVDRAEPSFELLAKRLRKVETPSFGDWKQRLRSSGAGIIMYSSKQCPFMRGEKDLARKEWLSSDYGLNVNLVQINDHKAAQMNPCVWGTAGIVYAGKIINYVPGGNAHLLNELQRMCAT